MKTIHSLALALSVLILSSFTVPDSNNSECGNLTLDEELQKLLRSPDITVEKSFTATVMLTANERGELIVLSVKTDNEQVDNYVKQRLNYQQLCNSLEIGQLYSLPITLKSP